MVSYAEVVAIARPGRRPRVIGDKCKRGVVPSTTMMQTTTGMWISQLFMQFQRCRIQ